ncbi:ABC transporter permease [Bacillaceae bacterium S4-13-58]
MLTTLFLRLKQLIDKPWMMLFLILIPMIVVLAIQPLIQKSMDTVGIPIAVVGLEQTGSSDFIELKLSEADRIDIRHLDEKQSLTLLQKGEVEAVFVFDEEFEEILQSGEIKKAITWYRTGESQLDFIVKEKIASLVTRYAINSKAAQQVSSHTDVSWQKAWDYSDEFWEPEPLFQIEHEMIVTKEIQQEEKPSVQMSSLLWAGFFLYLSWSTLLYLHEPLIHEKRKGILERIRSNKGTILPYYLGHFVFTTGITLLVFFLYLMISYLWKGQLLFSFSEMLSILGWVYIVGIGFPLLLQYFIRDIKIYRMVILIYPLLSYAVFFMIFFQIYDIGLLKWMFPHVWYYYWLLG